MQLTTIRFRQNLAGGEGASIRPEGDRLCRRGALWQGPDWRVGCTQSRQ
jgi:hypothetical protein